MDFFGKILFYFKNTYSFQTRNLESERIKVHEKRGNTTLISVITVWRIKDTFKAVFEVNQHEQFVRFQSDEAVRILVGAYNYDDSEHSDELTLRGGTDEINEALEEHWQYGCQWQALKYEKSELVTWHILKKLPELC
jgi:hypothetical protein